MIYLRKMEAIFMNEFIKKYSRDSLLVSVVLILLGLFLIFKPALSINVVMVALGLILAFYGVIQTVSYFSNSRQIEFFNFQLVIGLVSLLAGLVCIFNPSFINSILPLAIGVWIVLKSITTVQLAFNIKNTGTDNSWLAMLTLAIVTFILGIIVVMNPFEAAAAAVSICGAMLVISELINVFETVYMMKMVK